MNKILILCVLTVLYSSLNSCSKSDFLDKKPSSDIVLPTTLSEFQELLDNTQEVNGMSGLPQLSCDDYETSYQDWQTVSSTERNAYIWAADIYQGDQAIPDWNYPYKQVFYTNVVLEGLEQNKLSATPQGSMLKGWALFARAFAFHDLAKSFCAVYDKASADTDLGLPLRLKAAVDYLEPRSTLAKTYAQILSDAKTSAELLPVERPSALNRPNKASAYALLARIYLDMRQYEQALYYAEQALAIYSTLIDYNTVSKTSTTPFSSRNDELLFNRAQNAGFYNLTTNSVSSPAKISLGLVDLYEPNDLRKSVYFTKNASTGLYTKKRGYSGTGLYPFMGLATDELYLIRAECLARKGDTNSAMEWLNKLLIKRYTQNTFVPLKAHNSTEALNNIMLERRKELIWRGLRWHDIRRLNKEGANIILKRELNGITYTLPANDPRYVFPIPGDEIVLSGIQQNERN